MSETEQAPQEPEETSTEGEQAAEATETVEGAEAEALATGEEVPLLLSIGGLGDGRELLAGWETLGPLLVASGPGTDDASGQVKGTAR